MSGINFVITIMVMAVPFPIYINLGGLQNKERADKFWESIQNDVSNKW